MGYRRIDQNMTFAEVSLLKSLEHNRSLKRLEKINQAIDWSEVEEILTAHYTIGSSREGADAYFPLTLLKGLLLQKSGIVLIPTRKRKTRSMTVYPLRSS